MLERLNFGLRQLTTREFAALGIEHVAYVKSMRVDNRDVFAIHIADGRQVAVLDSHDVAVATVRQNDLEPLSVH